MLSRREVLVKTISAGAIVGKQLFPAVAFQGKTAINFEMPVGACDCHVHIFGDPVKFPFAPGRTYTPKTALPEELGVLHKALHLQRVVIVSPSVYGADNSVTLYGMRARGANARGVAVIGEKTTETELAALERAGVRGIRLNFAINGISDPAVIRQRLQAAAERVKKFNLHIQILTNLPNIAAIKDVIATSPVPIVIDHFGGARAELGPSQPGFAEMVSLVESGKAYVKISGAYRASTLSPDYADVAPLAKMLIAANPNRIVWGSDWPHTNSAPPGGKPTDVTPFLPIDDGRLLNQLLVWAPDPAIRKKILVDNPVHLYGF